MSRHVQKDQTKNINMPSSDLFLVSETEKHPRKAVSGGSGTKSGDEMEACLTQNSDLLKDFTKELRSKILEFAVKRENQGFKSTEHVIRVLRNFIRHGADLYDPENVKHVLKGLQVSETSKWIYATYYETFLRFLGGTWEKPTYRQQFKIPFIPTEEEIDLLIAGLGLVTAAFCQIAKETAARKGEIERLKWTDIDFERRLIMINNPEKNSRPRVIPVSEQCMAMIKQLPKKGERLFAASIRQSFWKQRKKMAFRLNNPRILKITIHTFRHWKATMEYHKTHDPLYVRDFLGHKSITNTEIYVTIERTIFQTQTDEFNVKVATSLEEFAKLLEVGFEYVSDYDGKKILRKRK